MPTRVKICGITRLEDAQLAVELGAAALGFNFYRPSPRYVEPAVARDIIRRLPPFTTAVGVFADQEDAAQILAAADEAGVQVVQLHGPKLPPEDAIGRYPAIRAIGLGPESDQELTESMVRAVTQSAPRVLLLDTADPVLRGGTGRTFDWKSARRISRHRRVILAGGLTPENVEEAITQVRPYAVDVATGVECEPGVKDAARMKAFFKAVEQADRRIESLAH
jgi:phosphoribosylanthranilate isomerase